MPVPSCYVYHTYSGNCFFFFCTSVSYISDVLYQHLVGPTLYQTSCTRLQATIPATLWQPLQCLSSSWAAATSSHHHSTLLKAVATALHLSGSGLTNSCWLAVTATASAISGGGASIRTVQSMVAGTNQVVVLVPATATIWTQWAVPSAGTTP